MFFFNDTATTEIYTYGHTLSRHDALPSYGRDRAGIEREPVRPKPACAGGCHGGAGRSAPLSRSARRRPQARAGREAWSRSAANRPRQRFERAADAAGAGVRRAGRGRGDAAVRRSEEHTSELQSLMRISYDVFFWNK